MNQKYLIELDEKQRQHLEKITSSGTYPSRQIKLAQILLKSDKKAGWSYEQISTAFGVTAVTIAKCARTMSSMGWKQH